MKKLLMFKGDKVIWIIVFFFSLISIIAVFSSIGRIAETRADHSALMPTVKHIAFVILSYVFAIALANSKYERLAKFVPYVFWFAVALQAFCAIACGGRWIPIIPGKVTFQPSELSKVALVMMLAREISVNHDKLDDLETFIKMAFYTLLTAVLIIFDNFSTAALVILIGLIMMFFGGINRRYWWRSVGTIVVAGILLLSISYIYYSNNIEPTKAMPKRAATWGHRVYDWFNRDTDSYTQENMARMAIATGGIKGIGIGNTVQARMMTQAESDFIYAIIIEETGCVVGIIIYLLYSVLFFRCLRHTNRCNGMYGSLLLLGYGSLIFIQALTNIFVALGIIPVTGQTLPLISHGGSSYLCTGIAIGLIQSVVYNANRNEIDTRERQRDEAEFAELQELSNRINS